MKATITINESTRKRLAIFGNLLSNWDSVINELIDHADKCDQFWEDRT